jgi:hypothetical protein
MWLRVVRWKQTDISEEHVASIFLHPPCSLETSLDFEWTTVHYTPEDTTLHNHRCEYLE